MTGGDPFLDAVTGGAEQQDTDPAPKAPETTAKGNGAAGTPQPAPAEPKKAAPKKAKSEAKKPAAKKAKPAAKTQDKPAKKAKPAAKKAKPAAKAPKKPAKKAAKSKAEVPKKPARTPLKQTRGLYPCYIGTRQAAMVDMLTRKDGATCKEIAAELGWLAGSVRTAFDLDMRKKGYTVEPTGEKRDGCKVYRIKVKPLPHIPMTAE